MRDHITFLSYHPSQSISILDGSWNLDRATEVVVKEAKVVSELDQVFRLGVHRIKEDGIMCRCCNTLSHDLAYQVEIVNILGGDGMIKDCS